MGLIKVKGKVEDEDFVNTKSDQVNNMIEILSQIKENEVVIFRDRSALGNPGPTGAGAVVYLNGPTGFCKTPDFGKHAES